MSETYKIFTDLQNNTELSKEEREQKLKELIDTHLKKKKPMTDEEKAITKQYFLDYRKNNPKKYDKYKKNAKDQYLKKKEKTVFCEDCECHYKFLGWNRHVKTKKHLINKGVLKKETKCLSGKCTVCENGKEYLNLKTHYLTKMHLRNMLKKDA